MAEVRFTPRAEADLFEIWSAIALDNGRAADALVRRLMERAGGAAEQPLMGAPRPDLSATARLLVEGRYVMVYEPEPQGILVVAIVHGMRDMALWLSSRR